MLEHHALLESLAKFAQTLVTDYKTEPPFQDLCRELVRILPLSGAGIMLADRQGALQVAAASDDKALRLEQRQRELGGPCQRSLQSQQSVVIPDLRAETGMPGFTSEAIEAGIAAVYAFPLRLGRQPMIGSLDLYADHQGALDAQAQEAVRVLVEMITALLVSARQVVEARVETDQLQHALVSRVAIEQAKGMLAAQTDRSPDAAFRILRAHARSNNLRLADVARQVIEGRLLLGNPSRQSN